MSQCCPQFLVSMKLISKGFTLIEILVVMLIIGISSTMIYVNLGKNQDSHDNRVFAEKMISMCKKTRQRALVQGDTSVFNIMASERKCWIENTELLLEIPESIRMEGEGIVRTEDDIYQITFFPDGSSTGGELLLSAGERTLYEFRIDMLTGVVEIMDDSSK